MDRREGGHLWEEGWLGSFGDLEGHEINQYIAYYYQISGFRESGSFNNLVATTEIDYHYTITSSLRRRRNF
jgi:hypothetical protein